MLYIQFWAPDDGRRNRLKHVEHFTEINKFCNVASCWLYLKILSRRTDPWTSNLFCYSKLHVSAQKSFRPKHLVQFNGINCFVLTWYIVITIVKKHSGHYMYRLLKCDGARAETRFRLSAKQASAFKSAGASVQLTTGSRSVRISGSHAGYTMFRGSVKIPGYSFHSPVSPLLPHPCVTVCHCILTGLYLQFNLQKFCVLPTQCVYVFCVDLRKNSDYFLI